MTWPTTRWPTSAEIFDRLRELGGRDPARCRAFDLPNPTFHAGGVPNSNYVRMGKLDAGNPARNKVVIVAGVHAREYAPATAVTNMIQLLLDASIAGTPITTGGATRSADDVAAIMEHVDLYVAPMANPEGYDFSLAHDAFPGPGWRKNRRPEPSPYPAAVASCPSGSPAAIGVDINRNFDVLWKAEDFYVPGAGVSSSPDPCEDSYRGTAAWSEPESNNVKFLLDKDPAFFVDVHMHGRFVYHSWGVEDNDLISGVTPALAPGKVRDGTVPAGDPAFNGYREPIQQSFRDAVFALASLMADATGLATGAPNRYRPVHGAELGAIAGASDDYAYSRNLGTARPHIKSFTIECGKTFVPRFDVEFPGIQLEVQAALLALLRHAAVPPTAAPSDSSCRRCS